MAQTVTNRLLWCGHNLIMSSGNILQKFQLEAIKQTQVDMEVFLGNYPIPTDNTAYTRQRDEIKAAIQVDNSKDISMAPLTYPTDIWHGPHSWYNSRK